MFKKNKITIVGQYVGMSLAVLLSKNEVVILDLDNERMTK